MSNRWIPNAFAALFELVLIVSWPIILGFSAVKGTKRGLDNFLLFTEPRFCFPVFSCLFSAGNRVENAHCMHI